jgi:hypothetical protein
MQVAIMPTHTVRSSNGAHNQDVLGLLSPNPPNLRQQLTGSAPSFLLA